jgi:hypothetical protein
VSGLKGIVTKNNVDIVICKGYIDSRVYPIPGFWKTFPIRGTLGSPNFIVKKRLFMRYAQYWCQEKAGDFHFIKHAFMDGKTFWWDRFVFDAPVGLCKPEETTALQKEFFEMQEEHDRNKDTVHARYAAR